MSLSRPKQNLRHYKSLQHLYTCQPESSQEKKTAKRHENNYRIQNNDKKKYSNNRLLTQIQDKTVCSKEEMKKYSNLFKTINKNKSTILHSKQPQSNKMNTQYTKSTKKLEKNKIRSPIIKKEITQNEKLIKKRKDHKVNLKKGKQNQSNYKLRFKNYHYESKIAQIKELSKNKRETQKSENKNKPMSQAKQKNKRNSAKKMFTQFSLQSTPSCLCNEDIQLIDIVGQGTFGKVFKARLKKTGQIIAVKKVLQDSRYKNREIQIIKLLKNDFVMEVIGSYITYEGRLQYLNIMMKYYDQNLFNRIKKLGKVRISNVQIKIIIYQIFKGLSYIHSLNICHRDVKPENILLKGNSVALCDFGSAKILNLNENNISYICARCYRAPELIFGSKKYNFAIDIWAAGCVILEILNGDPLFIGDTSINHLIQIIHILGTPTESEVANMNPQYDIRDYKFPKIQRKKWIQIFPDTDPFLLDLIDKIMVYSPKQRLTALQILAHQYFDQLKEELLYGHIQKQYRLKDFFNFSQVKLDGNHTLKSKLIPSWYLKI